MRRVHASRAAPTATRELVTNQEVAAALNEMALRMALTDVPFKPRAYERAAYTVTALQRPLHAIYDEAGVDGLEELPGIGAGIARRIGELLTTGRLKDLEAMRRRVPVDVVGLTQIEGVGPKTVKALYARLKIHDVEELLRAARAGRLRDLPRFSEKVEAKILRHIDLLKVSAGRQPFPEVLPLARAIERRLKKLPFVSEVAAAGSLRRAKETVGDLDFVVASTRPDAVVDAFIAMPEVAHRYAAGNSKGLVRLKSGIDADLRVVMPAHYAAALLYFTGSKAHNIALRRLAQDKGLKLNEYGLFAGERYLAGESEASIYAALGLSFIPPELREDSGEIEQASAGALPRLIEPGDLQGDLQVHTTWSDGASPLHIMVAAARERGYTYIAVTDHTRDLRIAGGADEERLLAQVQLVRQLNDSLSGFRVLAGAEVNIRPDGTLDIADRVLAALDLVGVAVHSHFNQPRAEMTRRIVTAMHHPHVHVLFHPSGRLLGRRPAMDVDMAAVIRAARSTGTILEVNAQPQRLDLASDEVRAAIRAGVKLAVSADAHAPAQLDFARDYGVPIARRGFATRGDVVNCLPVEGLLALLRGRS